MAKLPGVPDLGSIPTPDAARPVGTYDVGGFARGGAALAEGAQKLGTGLGKLGEGVADYALDENRWDYAKAHSDFLTRKVDLDAETARDLNYGPDASGKTLTERYGDSLTTLKQNSAALISSGPMRDRFMMDVAPIAAQGQERAENHARAQSNNADIAYVTQQGDAIMDRAVHAPDDATRTQLIDSHNQLIDGLVAKGAMTPVQAVSQKQAWAHQYATADLLARANTDPQGVINELQAKPGSPDGLVNRIIKIESDGNPSARASTSSAFGAAQFLASRPGGDQTWFELLKANRPELVKGKSLEEINALRGDPNLSREMLGHLVEANRSILGKNGVEATPGALYLSHFLGPKGAVAVLQANPGQPVADVLAKAVGPGMASKMVEANQSVLGGRLAGSVTQWADRKMGGASPGGGGVYDFLRPDVREQILAHAQTQVQKRNVDETAAFDQRYADSRAQAFDTGTPGPSPLTQGDFVGRFGAERGLQKYRDYEGDLAVAARLPTVAGMPPEAQQAFLNEVHPKEGEPGYATRLALHDKVAGMVGKLAAERAKDPAAYAAKYLPAVQEAWGKLSTALGDPAVPQEDKQAAARDYAAKTLLEQERVGVPEAARTIVPKGYVDNLNQSLMTPAANGGASMVAKRIEGEAQLWGDKWPLVYRQVAKEGAPVVRVIGSGVKPLAGQVLAEVAHTSVAQILNDNDTEKPALIKKAVLDAFKPLAGSMVGQEGAQRTFDDFQGQGEKLAAWYVARGATSQDAAKRAFDDLVGHKYEFRDGYRVPKSIPIAADDIARGAAAVKKALGAGAPASNLDAADRDLSLTPQEKALYQRHFTNLNGAGGVDNPDGSRSTLFQMSVEHDGKTYNVPTVWDGKILKPDDAIKRVQKEGWDKFPSYASEAEAEARYGKMHDYMERDTAAYLKRDRQLDVAPARDTVGGLSPSYLTAETRRAYARDGKWVTAPDESGLALVYADQAVRRADGSPLVLTWDELGRRARDSKRAPVTPVGQNLPSVN